MNPAERFWDWSLAFYQQPGVAEGCLALQDHSGADVNIVLLLLWRATEGAAPLDTPDLARLDAAIAPWRTEVIEPLRTLRRALKGRDEEAVRAPIQAAELAAERSAQRRLVNALPHTGAGQGTTRLRAAASLHCYGPLFPAPIVDRLLEQLIAVS